MFKQAIKNSLWGHYKEIAERINKGDYDFEDLKDATAESLQEDLTVQIEDVISELYEFESGFGRDAEKDLEQRIRSFLA